MKKRMRILYYLFIDLCAGIIARFAHPRFINNPATNFFSL